VTRHAPPTDAPLYEGLADGPPGGRAWWLKTSDGVRIRIAAWVPAGATTTVVLLPGRTEFVEKYGRAAADLAQRGYATLTVDWRGQGLADRALADPMTGHVLHFDEYQRDLDAVLAAATTLGLPDPAHLLSHSMGGAIALRALMRGLPFRTAVFSAPMWGIRIAPALRPVALALAGASGATGLAHHYAPGTFPVSYVATAPFAGNVLTTDPEMFDWMKVQVAAVPAFGLGGPSLGWLHAALTECRRLAARPSPRVPALTFLGLTERVVPIPPIHARMRRWPGGRLIEVPGAEHEVIMEGPAMRAAFFDAATAFFAAHPGEVAS